jgi:2-C-methyl-D-erythritol 4-phosphate cytidylyltransferase
MNFAVILAAGVGKRFGREKQFVKINNLPVIYYSIKALNQSPVIDKIIIVTKKERIGYLRKLVKRYKFIKVESIVEGGLKRQDSMRNALKILPDKGNIAIHDSARPLLNQSMITQGFRLVKKYKAVIPVLSVTDTIKQVKNDFVIKTIDRTDLSYVQTPQFFELGLVKKAYLKAEHTNYYATDDANLIERLWKKVYVIAGLKQNIKITDQEDLALVKKLL